MRSIKKYFILLFASLAAMSGCNPAIAGDEFTVVETKEPRMCEIQKAPVPCAFLIAMMNRMADKCRSPMCTSTKTCALKQ